MPVPTCSSADPAATLQALRSSGVVLWHDLPGDDAAARREAYLRALGRLGRVVQTEEVRLRPGAHAYVAKPGAVPLHTDHPDVDLIAWLCEAQDEIDGASRLLDMSPILANLDPTVRATLQRTELRCPPLSNGPPSESRWVLEQRGERVRFFLPPWIALVDGEDGASREAVDAVVRAVRTASSNGVMAVRLQPGQALVVDNGRVLHGRSAIAESSPRRLFRGWVQCG